MIRLTTQEAEEIRRLLRDQCLSGGTDDPGHCSYCRSALALLDRPEERCGACGSYVDVAYRGWTDDGSPMPTCARCGPPPTDRPEEAEKLAGILAAERREYDPEVMPVLAELGCDLRDVTVRAPESR